MSRETGDEVGVLAWVRDDGGSRGHGEKGARSGTTLE